MRVADAGATPAIFVTVYSVAAIRSPAKFREDAPMPNAFDPYREALVVERLTVWPDAYEDWSAGDKSRCESLLHENPRDAAELDYVRQHTGFARVITVTPADLERVSAAHT